MTRKTAVARFAIIVCAVLFTMVVSAQQITLKPGAIPDTEFHRVNARDFAYCEIAPVLGKPPMAQIYNSSALGDRCPVNEMAAIDPKKLAAELGAEFVYMNPTPQTARRYWVMDQLWVFGSWRDCGLSWHSGHLDGLDVARAFGRNAQERLCARRRPS